MASRRYFLAHVIHELHPHGRPPPQHHAHDVHVCVLLHGKPAGYVTAVLD